MPFSIHQKLISRKICIAVQFFILHNLKSECKSSDKNDIILRYVKFSKLIKVPFSDIFPEY